MAPSRLCRVPCGEDEAPAGMSKFEDVLAEGRPVEDLEVLRRAVDGGDLDATWNLGWMYMHGNGVAKDTAKACKLYQRVVDGGDIEGAFLLGMMYERGDDLAQNSPKAAKLYQRAVDGGSARAAFRLGWMYARGDGVAKSSTKACALYHRAVDGGNVRAALKLGSMYARGDGVDKDCARTCELWQWAADEGNPRAAFKLGWMYARGDGVAKDNAKACKLYRRAVDGGHMGATFNLGVKYLRGEGVARDCAKACKLLQRAADAGHAGAAFRLSVVSDTDDDEAEGTEGTLYSCEHRLDCGPCDTAHGSDGSRKRQAEVRSEREEPARKTRRKEQTAKSAGFVRARDKAENPHPGKTAVDRKKEAQRKRDVSKRLQEEARVTRFEISQMDGLTASQGSAAASAVASVLTDEVSILGDRELFDIVKKALSGKPQRKVADVVSKLKDVDIDCVKDIQCLAQDFRTPQTLTTWLQEQSKLPRVTCVRVAHYFFD